MPSTARDIHADAVGTLARTARLTPAEEVVVDGIFRGRSNETIARSRGTSTRTVANQVASIFRKCGVGSRIELVARHAPVATSWPAAAPSLTLRERAVAERAARGEPNKVIAAELGLAPSTVSGHLARALAKLGARSRVELMTLLRAASHHPSA